MTVKSPSWTRNASPRNKLYDQFDQLEVDKFILIPYLPTQTTTYKQQRGIASGIGYWQSKNKGKNLTLLATPDGIKVRRIK